MLTNRQISIIGVLNDTNDPVISSTLASKVGVSTRTIRNEMDYLKDYFIEHNYGCNIISVVSKGYLLQITDAEKFSSFFELYQRHSSIDGHIEDKNNKLICVLLIYDQFLHLAELETLLYMNRATIAQCSKLIQNRLEEFGLALVTSTKNGYRIEGNEFQRRLCLQYLINQRDPFINALCASYIPNAETQSLILNSIIKNLFEHKTIMISKVFMEDIAKLMWVSSQRNKENKLLKCGAEDYYVVDTFPNTAKTSEKTLHELNESGLQFNEDDSIFLTALLMSYRTYDIHDAYTEAHMQSYKISQDCVAQLGTRNIIQVTLLEDDFTWRLASYLTSFKIRNKYHISVHINHISEFDIKLRFSKSIEIAYHCLLILRDQYGFKINESEVIYLSPFFAYIHKWELLFSRKIKALVITSYGFTFDRIVKERLQVNYGNYFSSVEAKDLYAMQEDDYRGVEAIFTDLPASTFKANIAICPISMIINSVDSLRIYKFLDVFGSERLLDILPKENFHSDIAFTTKELYFKHLSNDINAYYKNNHNWYDFIANKEKIVSFERGNNTAVIFLQDDYFKEVKGFGYVLRKPIFWNHDYVQVIFVICCDFKANRSAFTSLREIRTVSQNFSFVAKLIDRKNYETLEEFINITPVYSI